MDYVVGSIAALLSGNVTPNRPKQLRNAQTPMKHQPSPNVTPKSEFVEDRSIFLSPTMQKKKAMAKKSPKRIFQNPDPDVTNGENNDSSLVSPKADKVKKHLKDDLKANSLAPTILLSPKSPKNSEVSPKKSNKKRLSDNIVIDENSPKKKKRKSDTGVNDSMIPNGEGISKTDTIENSISKKKNKKQLVIDENSPKKKKRKSDTGVNDSMIPNGEGISKTDTIENNISKKKNKKQQNEFIVEDINVNATTEMNSNTSLIQSPKKDKKKNKAKQNGNIEIKSASDDTPNIFKNDVDNKSNNNDVNPNAVTETQGPIKKKKNKRKKKPKQTNDQVESVNNSVTKYMEEDSKSKNKSENTAKETQGAKKNKNKRKKKAIQTKQIESNIELDSNNQNKAENTPTTDDQSPKKKNKKTKQNKKDDQDEAEAHKTVEVNPNAVTNQDSDSEHDSDDEIDLEDEAEINKKVLDTDPAEDSSDEEETPEEESKPKKDEKELHQKITEEEIKRTLFVGGVPFSAKTKKEMKKIFRKYGQIESVRVRAVPLKDARSTPKLAAIKNELHPDRATVNVYVRFTDADAVQKALVENNTVLNGCHLRVHPSDSSGVPHDTKCSIFVGNLPFTLEDEALRGKFENCGEIVSVRIIRDKATSIGKGFGYVNFKSKDGVELALAMTEEDLTIKNRILRVKRCTQPTEKQLQPKQRFNKPKIFGGGRQDSGKKGNFRRQDQGNVNGHSSRGKFGGRPDFAKKDNFRRQDQDNEGGNFGRGKFGGRPDFGKKDNFRRQDQGNFSRGKFDNQDGDKNSGAYRRVMNKRKNEESGEGPPSKKQSVDQPLREKKERKEFVGMTAEKKKKNKFSKELKKKKLLSEILTKNK